MKNYVVAYLRRKLSWVHYTALVSAFLGPFAVLLSVPSLTQSCKGFDIWLTRSDWRGNYLEPKYLANGVQNFTPLPNEPLTVALASVAFVLAVVANFVLLLEFSNFHAKVTSYVSFACFLSTVSIALANIISFGLTYPQGGGVLYLEGFWVRVFYYCIPCFTGFQ